MAQIEKDYWKWDETFGEKRLAFGEKLKIIKI